MTPTPRFEIGSSDLFVLGLFAIGAYLQAHGIQTYKTFYFFAWVLIVFMFLITSAPKS